MTRRKMPKFNLQPFPKTTIVVSTNPLVSFVPFVVKKKLFCSFIMVLFLLCRSLNRRNHSSTFAPPLRSLLLKALALLDASAFLCVLHDEKAITELRSPFFKVRACFYTCFHP